MDIIIILLLVIGLTLVGISWVRSDLNCPPPQVIYRYIPKHTLDVQFGEENAPSEVYKDMFTKSSPWIGGTTLGMGKTYIQEKKK